MGRMRVGVMMGMLGKPLAVEGGVHYYFYGEKRGVVQYNLLGEIGCTT